MKKQILLIITSTLLWMHKTLAPLDRASPVFCAEQLCHVLLLTQKYDFSQNGLKTSLIKAEKFSSWVSQFKHLALAAQENVELKINDTHLKKKVQKRLLLIRQFLTSNSKLEDTDPALKNEALKHIAFLIALDIANKTENYDLIKMQLSAYSHYEAPTWFATADKKFFTKIMNAAYANLQVIDRLPPDTLTHANTLNQMRILSQQIDLIKSQDTDWTIALRKCDELYNDKIVDSSNALLRLYVLYIIAIMQVLQLNKQFHQHTYLYLKAQKTSQAVWEAWENFNNQNEYIRAIFTYTIYIVVILLAIDKWIVKLDNPSPTGQRFVNGTIINGTNGSYVFFSF